MCSPLSKQLGMYVHTTYLHAKANCRLLRENKISLSCRLVEEINPPLHSFIQLHLKNTSHFQFGSLNQSPSKSGLKFPVVCKANKLPESTLLAVMLRLAGRRAGRQAGEWVLHVRTSLYICYQWIACKAGSANYEWCLLSSTSISVVGGGLLYKKQRRQGMFNTYIHYTGYVFCQKVFIKIQ